MDVNYWAAAYMAHATLTSWLSPTSPNKGTRRHLIFTASSTAFYAPVGYSPYSPAKAAMRSLSDTLSQEVLLYGEDIKIHTVFPGGILSPGFENENKVKPAITFVLEEGDVPQAAEEVASRAIKGLENGEHLITVNFLGNAMGAQMWSGESKNYWLFDTLLTLGTALAWPFIKMDLDGKVVKYGKKHGHPSTYEKAKDSGA
jgi:3-dehydrosphinganine reductase